MYWRKDVEARAVAKWGSLEKVRFFVYLKFGAIPDIFYIINSVFILGLNFSCVSF